MSGVQLTAELVESFSGTFLSPMYDDAAPTPDCHREWWEMYCADDPFVAVAAPRSHAKSTALTHDFILTNVLFRIEPHVLIVSATEELSLGHLGDIAMELRDNDDLHKHFQIDKFETDSKGEIIVRCRDGYQFRVLARGSGQKLRGMKWRGRRPGLIIVDDGEEDEQVENADRRAKYRRWVLRALIPLGRRGARVRWHGTILHEDAMLSRIMKDKSWISRLYKAHEAFDDFSNILWPEMWSEERLRARRDSYINQGDAAGYSQEYLNDPFDNSDAYLRRDDFLPMNEDDYASDKVMAVGCDFAVSKADRANRTSFTIGGKDTRNLIHIVDQRVGRWDPVEWIDELFSIQSAHDPAFFFVEGGVIWKAIEQTLYNEMQARDQFLNILVLNPVKDKATRGRPYQRRHRARAMRYDKKADWYPAYEAEQMRFTGHSEAVADDQFDSTATLILGFEQMPSVEEEDFRTQDEWDFLAADPRVETGRSKITGY